MNQLMRSSPTGRNSNRQFASGFRLRGSVASMAMVPGTRACGQAPKAAPTRKPGPGFALSFFVFVLVLVRRQDQSERVKPFSMRANKGDGI